MTLLEPTTVLTDYLLALLAGWLGWRLWRRGGSEQQLSVRLWAGSFVAMAAAALLGGTSHGVGNQLGPALSSALWRLTVWSIGLTAFLLLAGTAIPLQAAWRRALVRLAAAVFVVYALWMLRHDEFIWVILGYLPAVLLTLAIQSARWRRAVPGAGWIVAGLLGTLAASAVQAGGLSLHPRFNHNDLYHVVQMVALVMLYRGAGRARDRREDIS